MLDPRALALSAAILLGAATAPALGAEFLLRDDFDGPALDPNHWFLPEGEGTFLGRTQLRPGWAPPDVIGGVARLQLDTYNPTALIPGDSFWGTEIVTQDVFARGSGLSFRARVRLVAPVPRGLVVSLFSFVFQPATNDRDEIDFELLSNDLDDGLERAVTNVFDDDGFEVPGDVELTPVAGLDQSAWNELEIRWLPDRIQWFVNGALVREETDTVPNAPMPVRLNFWAPDAGFAVAFDAGLQPAASAAANQVFFYEVDWVEVRAMADTDGDTVPDDGDVSGVAGDNPCSCSPGDPVDCREDCDDACPLRADPDQLDRGGVQSAQYLPGDGSPDGIGDTCQCGDMNGDGGVDTSDLVLYRREFAGPVSPFSTDRCSVTGPGGDCDASDLVVMRRTFAGLTTGILAQVCAPALGLPEPP